MHLNTMLPRPEWLKPEEVKLYNKFRLPLLRYLRERGVALDPFLAVQINDIIIRNLYLHRAEAALCGEEDSPALLESLFNKRERLQKSMKELQERIADKAEGGNLTQRHEDHRENTEKAEERKAEVKEEKEMIDLTDPTDQKEQILNLKPQIPAMPPPIANFKSLLPLDPQVRATICNALKRQGNVSAAGPITLTRNR